MSGARSGIFLALGAYVTWGVLPLYWRLLRAANPIETLAHRVVWSLVFVGLLLAFNNGFGRLRTVGAKRLRLLSAAALLVGVNWGLYIWGVNSGYVVETALGYFINPLFTVILGVVALRERLRRAQWVSVGVAALAVAILTVNYGRPPLLALALASTFAIYGLLKKLAGVEPVLGLAVETIILVLPAAIYVELLGAKGQGAFGRGWLTSTLLVSTGIVTPVPLLLFAAAANRTPLTVLGPMQYIAPTLQFLCGVVVFREAMPASRWICFSLVWLALALFVVEGVLNQRKVKMSSLGHSPPEITRKT